MVIHHTASLITAKPFAPSPTANQVFSVLITFRTLFVQLTFIFAAKDPACLDRSRHSQHYPLTA
jgi:hypothetical protein